MGPHYWLLLSLCSIVIAVKKRTDPGALCQPNQCCKTNINGINFDVCLTGEGTLTVKDHPLPRIVQSPSTLGLNFKQQNRGRNIARSNDFTLKLISINIWGFKWPMSEDKELRVSKIIEFLESSDYDIIFMQEAWMFSDFQRILSFYPYSTTFGSPNTAFCPTVSNDQFLNLQFSALDCNGVTIFSKHPILSSKFVKFTDNVDVLDEKLIQRGFISAIIEVDKIVSGVRRRVKVTAVDPHLTTWYGEESHATDLVIIGGDLNSSPDSPVYNVFQSMVDCLVDLQGTGSLSAAEHATWGQQTNTFSGPGGGQYDGHLARIDYIFYRLRTGRVRSVETVDYKTIKEFTNKSDGSKISLSDHDWVEATIKLGF